MIKIIFAYYENNHIFEVKASGMKTNIYHRYFLCISLHTRYNKKVFESLG